MSSLPFLQQEELEELLRVQFDLSAHSWAQVPNIMEQAHAWYVYVVGQGYENLPLSLVMDLGLLLSAKKSLPLRSQSEYEAWSESERVIRLRYENELICRLPMLPQINELIELGRIGALPDAQIHRALVLLCKVFTKYYPKYYRIRLSQLRSTNFNHLLANTDFHEGVIKHAQSEDLTENSSKSVVDQRTAKTLHYEHLTEFLAQLSQHIKWNSLLSEADLFELRHWSRLHSEELRLGCRQLIELSHDLGRVTDSDLILIPESASAMAKYSDDTTYPTGGISGLTTSGAWENLVLSELIYIDDTQPNEIDLFDVRFVENELLFYLRDDGQVSTRRRLVDFIIDLPLLFKQKTLGYAYQFSIISQGLIYAVINDLMTLFSHDALKFRVSIITGDLPTETFVSELKLLQMLLLEEELRELVSFQVLSELDDDALIDHKRKRYAVLFTESDHATAWSQRLGLWREQEDVSTCCLSFGNYGAVYHQGLTVRQNAASQNHYLLPLSGMSNDELGDLKSVLLCHLLKAELRRALKLNIKPLDLSCDKTEYKSDLEPDLESEAEVMNEDKLR
jgi:hypothetical protein